MTEVVGARIPTPDLPAVDFSESMLIAVSMGRRGTGGYQISVDRIYRRGGELVVVVREISPGPSCMTTQALTAPIEIVQIPRSVEPIAFEVREETLDCG